jgi:Uma2 family endonuclease
MGIIEPPELLRRHRVTVQEYYRMAEVGLLAPDARVELIEGEVVDMATIGSRHGSVVKRLNALTMKAVGQRASVAVQDPVRLSSHSEPQPDLLLLRPRADFYASEHPGPQDVLLVVEVSDTTACYDRQIKAPLYARHGVPELWIIDLDNARLRVMRGPRDGDYTEIIETATPGRLEPQLLPGAVIDLTSILA